MRHIKQKRQQGSYCSQTIYNSLIRAKIWGAFHLPIISKFQSEVKWIVPFWFSQTKIFGTTTVSPVGPKFTRSILRNCFTALLQHSGMECKMARSIALDWPSFNRKMTFHFYNSQSLLVRLTVKMESTL